MTENQIEWARKRDELVSTIKKLGFPKDASKPVKAGSCWQSLVRI